MGAAPSAVPWQGLCLTLACSLRPAEGDLGRHQRSQGGDGPEPARVGGHGHLWWVARPLLRPFPFPLHCQEPLRESAMGRSVCRQDCTWGWLVCACRRSSPGPLIQGRPHRPPAGHLIFESFQLFIQFFTLSCVLQQSGIRSALHHHWGYPRGYPKCPSGSPQHQCWDHALLARGHVAC